MVRDPVLAEDVMQQVFLEAHRDFHRFRGLSSRRTWLFGIATHRCLDALKSRRAAQARIEPIEGRDERLDLPEPEAPGRGPFEQLGHAQLLAALDGCLTSLSDDVRATVLMRFHTDMTYEEMEPYLDASADALQMRVSRAMPVLRRCLETKGWTGE
jgi:RNA polymerase sigma-70 factor (ECF subfamily)